ncbi:MAG: 4-hydroxy-tetrahydrodipicolinate reductase [Bacteroidetes bacterium]|nr:4-hydroxy-tetrahydrodipicolinate reductase [Bacteroidota bacterium]
MRIAILGYGKMGKAIEEIALKHQHEIVLKINSHNRKNLTVEALKTADVVIEFSRPENAVENINLCFAAGVPVVVGTTGWYANLPKIKEDCFSKRGSLLYGTNFSVGVNIFYALNKKLASIMNGFPTYKVSVEEIHHTQKLDAPSGTATSLANQILAEMPRKKSWETIHRATTEIPLPETHFPVFYDRIDGVPGYHKVVYTSEIDKLEISHEAFNRQGFALGAVLAAEFLEDKKGVYTTDDLFEF